jgi:predicted permease
MDLRAAETGLTIAAWANGESEYTIETPSGVETQSVSTKFVSANYFPTFGVRLTRGSGFDDATDDPLHAEPVVILGDDFWRHHLGANPDIVGKRLPLNGVPHVVVGVAPELAFDERQIFIPLEEHPLLRARDTEAAKVRLDRANEWIHLHGRLLPGVGVAQARAAVVAVTSRLATQFPATNEFKSGSVEPYDPVGVLQRPQFRILQTVAQTLTGVVLLVVCLNISGMMLVRYATRERELSVRQAIGANRGQLIRNLLCEALILAALGGTLAALVLFNTPSLVLWLSEATIPAQLQHAMRVDAYMLLVCVAICFVTSLMCGLLPAIRFSHPTIISSLKDDAGVGGIRTGRIHRLTAALQVTIAVPLIVMAGISLDRIRSTATSDLGFAADDLYAAPIGLQDMPMETASFRIRRAQENLTQASGVVSVTVADGLPLDFGGRTNRISLQVAEDRAPAFVPVHVTRVGDDYFKTMAIPLVRGRGFTGDDRAGGEMVTVISTTLADQLFPNADASEALGAHVTFGANATQQDTLTIVGVTADFPTSQMSTGRAQILVPLAQHATSNVFLIARSHPGEPAQKLTAALENAIRDLDVNRGLSTGDGVAYARVVTGVWLRKNSMDDFLTQSMVAGGAGGVILLLSALGIYGVVGLMTATRTREIAVRVALGASRRSVISMILFDVVKLVLPGVGVGLVLTVALMRLNSENMGISLSQVENVAYVAGAAIAILVAILASLIPARRASSIQPMVAMRSQ